VRWAALVLVALALTGCETTAEKSARLERLAKQSGAHEQATQKALSVTRASKRVKVLDATLLRSAEGAAAVVKVRNLSSRPLRAVPIEITVKDSSGRQLFQNDAAGTEAGLVSISSLPPHGELRWVDDQLPAAGAPSALGARVGEAPAVNASVPRIAVSAMRLVEDPTNGVGAAGTVTNRSHTAQPKLVVFVLSLKAGRIIAAGRAVLPELAAGASAPFQAFLIGDPRGGTLQASAPATSFG
jgi:hypothetical protein